jgi:hypothetical protein
VQIGSSGALICSTRRMAARPSLGDHVRILDHPETSAGGWAGREGTCYGFTTPSVTGVEVIGKTEDDDALSVGFDDGQSAWFAPHLVEFLDHAPGLEITIGDNRLVRDESGEWREPKRRRFGWHRK